MCKSRLGKPSGITDRDRYLVAGIEGIVAAHYRKLVAEKTRDALARLRANGKRVSGHLPYGYRLLAEARLAPDAGEQATLRRIGALHAAGLSLRGISRALAADGAMARNGRPFAARTLSRLVTDRPVSHSASAL